MRGLSTDPDIWISADGRKTPIGELKSPHLCSILKFLKRQSKTIHYNSAWAKFQAKEMKFEDFTKAISGEDFDWTSVNVCIPNLLAEASRRDIDWENSREYPVPTKIKEFNTSTWGWIPPEIYRMSPTVDSVVERITHI